MSLKQLKLLKRMAGQHDPEAVLTCIAIDYMQGRYELEPDLQMVELTSKALGLGKAHD